MIALSGTITQPVLANLAPSGMITGPTFPGGALRTWAESTCCTPSTEMVQQARRVAVLSSTTALPEACGGPFGTDAELVSLVLKTASKRFGFGVVVCRVEVVAVVVGVLECELPHAASVASNATIAKTLEALKPAPS